jgi:L-ascorbate metabolism protein UlaG (beta-lactamase superfamily)
MKLTKFGHCCLLIETKGLKILTDPGNFTTEQNEVKDIDMVLITHEHGDHLHVDSLKEVIKNNPEARVFTNSGVGKILDENGISCTLLEGRATETIGEVQIEAYDGKHEEIYKDFGQVQNTGYFIDNKLFYPGDSFHNPEREVEVLALPVAGPWAVIHEVINYALAVKPKKVFPVHDGMIKESFRGFTKMLGDAILKDKGIEFVPMADGETKEF